MEAVVLRIIVANEPRAYREVIAASLHALRPEAEVVAIEPSALDREVITRRPHLVVCSSLSEAVEMCTLTWVLLYPSGESLAVVSVAGRKTTIPNIEFAELLAVVDQTEKLAQVS